MSEKAVLISIRPKWCQKIISGEKTIEVRKTRPKINPPFKCYIYCSQGSDVRRLRGSWGKVIGAFTCDAITRVNLCGFWDDSGKQLDNRLKETCLTSKEFCDYLGEKVGYGWHISNLEIYDSPKKLEEFRAPELPTGLRYEADVIKRPPQSWRYVEEAKRP